MARSPMSIRQLVNTAFAAAFVVLAGTGIGASWWSRTAADAANRRRLSFDRRSEFIHLLTLVQDAETSQRGFILTGFPEQLDAYRAALGRIDAQRPRLDSLAHGDAALERAAASLERDIAAKRAEMDSTIALRQGGLQTSIALVRAGPGAALMDSIRGTIAQVERTETATVEQYDARAVRAQRLTIVLGTTLGAATLLFLVLAFIVFNRTLTRWMAAERIVAESESRLTQILDALPVGVFVAGVDGKAHYANRESKRLLGKGLVPGAPLSELSNIYQAYRAGTDDLYPPDQLPIALAVRGQSTVRTDLEIHQGDVRVPLEIVSTPVRDARGAVVYGLSAFTDITVRRASERAIQEARDAAETANRAKSSFLARMSHELRTPLNSIIGFSEVLADETFGALNDRQRRYVSNVLTSGRHLLDLINDILDLSKIEAGRMELVLSPLSINAALADLRQQLEPMATKKHQQLDIVVQAGLKPLMADPVRLRQMVSNLMTNAIKYTPDRGQITVEARAVAPDGGADGEWIEIAVTDTGIGIGPADHERIFADFEQATSAYVREQEGTGLGLPLVRRLAALHGGHVTLESALGSGSTFRLRLPVAGPDSSRALRPDRMPAEGSAPLVLVVDDEPTAADLLSYYLREAGYRVAIATTGDSAMEMARAMRPLAITLDILLPDRDGLNVLARLKSAPETRDIPVIVVSITEDRAVGFSLGAAEWFVKPVSRENLLSAVRRVLAPRTAGTALVIDDDPQAIEIISGYLGQAGFTVDSALDGRTGIDRAIKEKPDVVVLDLVMPGVNGFDVVNALREHPDGRDLPILICTSKDLTDDDRMRLRGSVQGLVRKGALRERLLHEIRRATGLTV